MATDIGKGLIISLDQIGTLSGAGRGVKLMNVGKGKLVGLISVKSEEKVTLKFEDGGSREINLKDVPLYNRGSMGITVSKRKRIAIITSI